LQPVRLVLLQLIGAREGENDFVEFSSVDEALAYGRQIHGKPKFQLDGIEDSAGRSVMAYDELNELCRMPYPMPLRMRAVGE
jgi:hypothetical protein